MLKQRVTALYSNRCLSYHQLGKQKEVIADADYVIKNLDAKNIKMLYRRQFAY